MGSDRCRIRIGFAVSVVAVCHLSYSGGLGQAILALGAVLLIPVGFGLGIGYEAAKEFGLEFGLIKD